MVEVLLLLIRYLWVNRKYLEPHNREKNYLEMFKYNLWKKNQWCKETKF